MHAPDGAGGLRPTKYTPRAHRDACLCEAGGLRPLKYTQGHTVIHALDGASGLRPLMYIFIFLPAVR